MSYRYTLEAALESLQDIGELIRRFPEDGEVPSIELDLSLQKLRNIYELLLVLKKPADLPVYQAFGRNTASAAAAAPVATAAQVEEAAAASEATSLAGAAAEKAVAAAAAEVTSAAEEATAAAEVMSASEAAAEVQVTAAVAEVHISVPEPAPAPVPVSSSATVSAPPSVQEKETIVEIHGAAQILSDRFKGRATLHETFHQTMSTDGQLHSQGKPVENLLSVIAINDRFTFIRELFNGDSHAFEHAIKALNEAANFNDAYNFMTRNYEWDMNSDAVQLLLDIIRRKYIISRNE